MNDGVWWVQLGLKLLSVLEKVLPAFLLAWNESLRNKFRREKNQHEHTKNQLVVAKKHAEIDQKFAGKSDRDVVDDFLSGDG